VGFGIALVISMVLSLIFVITIGGDPAVIADNPLFLILNVALNLTFNLAGLLSFIIGIYTIIKHKEWLVCKYLAVLYGLAFLMFILGEFIFSH